MNIAVAAAGAGQRRALFAQAQLLDERAIAVAVARLQVVEELAPAGDHAQDVRSERILTLLISGKRFARIRWVRFVNFNSGSPSPGRSLTHTSDHHGNSCRFRL